MVVWNSSNHWLAALRICGSGWWYNAWRASSSVARGPCPSIFFANKSALNHSPVFPKHTRGKERKGKGKEKKGGRGLKNRKSNFALDGDKTCHAREWELIQMRVRDEGERERGERRRASEMGRDCFCAFVTPPPPSHLLMFHTLTRMLIPGCCPGIYVTGVSPVSQCEVEPHWLSPSVCVVLIPEFAKSQN